jgi:hypothetical protein
LNPWTGWGLSEITYDRKPAVRIPYYGPGSEELAGRGRDATERGRKGEAQQADDEGPLAASVVGDATGYVLHRRREMNEGMFPNWTQAKNNSKNDSSRVHTDAPLS